MTNVLDFTMKTDIGDRNPLGNFEVGDVWEYLVPVQTPISNFIGVLLSKPVRVMITLLRDDDIVFAQGEVTNSRRKEDFKALLIATNASFIGHLKVKGKSERDPFTSPKTGDVFLDMNDHELVVGEVGNSVCLFKFGEHKYYSFGNLQAYLHSVGARVKSLA